MNHDEDNVEAAQNEPFINKRLVITVLTLVVMLWLVNLLALAWQGDARGTFGDMFGAVNALFSGLAFAILIITLLLQRQELTLQRRELRLTRQVMTGQKELLSQQSFEGTFFQLLNVHTSIIDSLDIVTKQSTQDSVTGRDCFTHIWGRMADFLSIKDNADLVGKDRLKKLQDMYQAVWESYSGELGIYFRTLYNILKYVDESQVRDKKRYTNLVRAQISEQELLLILYNCIWYPDSNLVPLLNKYDLLKHLPRDVVVDTDLALFAGLKQDG